jgi:hypothetical protein
LHRAQKHTPSHKQEGICAQALKSSGLVLKPWSHTRICGAFTNHETTAQSTRRHESM